MLRNAAGRKINLEGEAVFWHEVFRVMEARETVFSAVKNKEKKDFNLLCFILF